MTVSVTKCWIFLKLKCLSKQQMQWYLLCLCIIFHNNSHEHSIVTYKVCLFWLLSCYRQISIFGLKNGSYLHCHWWLKKSNILNNNALSSWESILCMWNIDKYFLHSRYPKMLINLSGYLPLMLPYQTALLLNVKCTKTQIITLWEHKLVSTGTNFTWKGVNGTLFRRWVKKSDTE